MDIEAALEHARQVSREMVWLGRSTPEAMTQLLTAYRAYIEKGVEGTFIQLLVARGVVDPSLRASLELEFPPDRLRIKPSAEEGGSTTAVLRRIDLNVPSHPTLDLPASAEPSAKLWLEIDPFSPFPLPPGAVLSLGRSQTCDVRLPHQGVSRVHAEIRSDESGEALTLEDGSTFGTFVNGEKVHRTKQEITPGDVIAIGPYMIIVRDEDPGIRENDTLPFRIPGFAVESMHGKLSEVSLGEVLQQIEFNEKSGTLRIIAGHLRGLVAFRGGRPLWAQIGEKRDADAVFAMINLEEGEFSFMSAIEPGEQTIHGTVTGLLMDVSRRIDEG